MPHRELKHPRQVEDWLVELSQRTQVTSSTPDSVWGPYPNYDDIARFEYGRRMWRLPDMRARLLKHWLDDRHPYRERFLRQRLLLEQILNSSEPEEEVSRQLLGQGTSLRCMAREIPPVFGSFF